LFAAFAKEHYPVRKVQSSQLVLSRAMLPRSTEVYVLTHPHPDAFGD
jgi:hypothetical protein